MKKHLKGIKRIQNVAYGRCNFLRLDKNENLIPFPGRFIQEIQKNITSDFISSYPEVSPLYERIAKWIGCDKENIYITAGSDAAIKSVFEVFIQPKDKVLILHPTYAMYYVYAQMFQAKLLKVEYKKDCSISREEILSCIEKERPRSVCIANPNSPTGTVLLRQWLEDIIRIAAKYSTIVLVDEAYALYYPHSVIGLVDKYHNLVVIRTFSKALGIASARLGFIVGNRAVVAGLQKVRPMYETNAFAVLLGKLILDNFALIKSNLNKIIEGKAYLEREVVKMGLKYHKSFSNFVNIDVGAYEKSVELVRYMRKRKILIGGSYQHRCLKNCIRVTAGTKLQMGKFLKELKIALNK